MLLQQSAFEGRAEVFGRVMRVRIAHGAITLADDDMTFAEATAMFTKMQTGELNDVMPLLSLVDDKVEGKMRVEVAPVATANKPVPAQAPAVTPVAQAATPAQAPVANATNGAMSPDDAALKNAKRLRDVLQYFIDHGLADDEEIVAMCVKYAKDVPLLKRVANLEARMRTTLDALRKGELQ